ncbi:MAG: AI-2E family transporter, partial [Candidatus Methylomirabilales bacterium]
WGVVSWAIIGVLLLAYFVYRYAIEPISVIFPPLVVALIVIYLLNPIVSALEQRGVPRLLGALITYLVFLTAVGFGLAYLIPVIANQVEGFVRSVPDLIERAQSSFSDILGRFGENTQGSEGVLNEQNQQAILDFLGRILSFTRGLFDIVLVLILGPILAFYLLVDLPKIKRGLIAMIPANRREEVISVTRRLGRALGGFFRGQMLVALFVGLASMLVLFIVGLPYWALVGMITGLFNLIPLIGPFIGGILAAFVAFTTDTSGGGFLGLESGWPLAIGSAVALTIVQQIDNHIISPNIVARTVKLHPVTVMLALLAGGTLLGLWGMLLAVPVVASAKILLLYAWDTRLTWPPKATSGEVGVEGIEPGLDGTPPPEVSQPVLGRFLRRRRGRQQAVKGRSIPKR